MELEYRLEYIRGIRRHSFAQELVLKQRNGVLLLLCPPDFSEDFHLSGVPCKEPLEPISFSVLRFDCGWHFILSLFLSYIAASEEFSEHLDVIGSGNANRKNK